jgi:hypothetical protein
MRARPGSRPILDLSGIPLVASTFSRTASFAVFPAEVSIITSSYGTPVSSRASLKEA